MEGAGIPESQFGRLSAKYLIGTVMSVRCKPFIVLSHNIKNCVN